MNKKPSERMKEIVGKLRYNESLDPICTLEEFAAQYWEELNYFQRALCQYLDEEWEKK